MRRAISMLIMLVSLALSGRANASPQCLPPQTDDFGDGMLSSYFTWYPVDGSVCPPPIESGGKLVMKKAGQCGPVASQGLVLDPANYVLCGDFDVSIDYELITFDLPTVGYRVAGLEVDTPAGAFVAAIARLSFSGDGCKSRAQYHQAVLPGSAGTCRSEGMIVSNASSGGYRMRREGSTMTLYWRDAPGPWNTLLAGAVTSENLIMHIATGYRDTPSRDQEVWFDNLSVITAGATPTKQMPWSALKILYR